MPILAYIDAEKRDGPIRISLHGDIPSDLIVYISEHYQEVTELNATWTFEQPLLECFTIYPKDMRFLNPKKDMYSKHQFQRLFFAFDTQVTLATFFVHVSFPKEDRNNSMRLKADSIDLDEQEAQAERNFREI